MATPTVESKKPKMRFRTRLVAPAAFIALLGALLVVALGSAGSPADVAASTAPSTPSAWGQAPVGVATSARPAASCSNVRATVHATLHLPAGTATGTISGDINGLVSAHISHIRQSEDGTLHVLMEHTYTNTDPLGTFDTSDHAVLSPVDASNKLYRMNNRLTIVSGSGSGSYSGASGYIHTHGDLHLVDSGSINLSLNGRLCV